MKRILVISTAVLAFIAIGLADSPHIPRGAAVVAEQDFLSQTGSLPTTTLFTPTNDGTFRVSLYTEMSGTPSGSTQVQSFLGWTDDVTTQPDASGFHCGVFVNASAEFGQNTCVIHAKANTAIKIIGSTVVLPAGGNFSTFAIVEQL